jgi:hypothetical protein
MNIEKTMYGSLKISVLIQNQLFERQYYGYSRAGAIRKFKEELKQIKQQFKN